jgi:ElaA protein
MDVQIKAYEELSLDELYDLLALRTRIFVVEQNCPYQELDGKDKFAVHLLLLNKEELIGTLRILPPKKAHDSIHIGRVVVSSEKRGKNLGQKIMNEALKYIHSNWGEIHIIISAQSHLQTFYEKLGFISVNNHYLEDGIPHLEMHFNYKK